MDKNTKKMLIIGGVGVAGFAFWYFFFGPGAAPAGGATAQSGSSSPSGAAASEVSANAQYSPADLANIQQIEAWINTMPTNSAQQEYWLGVINSNPSSAVISLWVQCLNVFGTKGASLTASQQAFWNNLSQGH